MRIGPFSFSFGRKEAAVPRKANLREELTGRNFQYEAAQSDRLNREHWRDAKGQLINNELRMSLETMRWRANLEVKRNPTLKGIIETHRTDIVGTCGPTLQLMSENEEYCALRKKVFMAWAENPDAQGRMSLASLLRMNISSCWLNGAGVFQEVIKPGVDGPIKMRILAIDPARMVTPPSEFGKPDVSLGQRMDAFGAPVSYFFRNMDHFGDSWFWNGKYDEISAENIVHFYIPEEANQFNGVPWCAAILPRAAQLRDLDQAVLDAAQMQAEFSPVLLESEPVPGQEPITLEGETEIERRTMRALPPGWKGNQLTPTQPGDNFLDFRHEFMGDMGAIVNMPAMLVRKNSGEWNLSSVRFDMGVYRRSIDWIRDEIENKIVNRWEAIVAYEAELAGALPEAPADLQRSWTWPKLASADPKSDAQTTEQEMINGTTDFGEACRQQDKNPEEVMAARKKWFDANEAAGLPDLPHFIVPGAATAQDGADPNAPAKKPAAKITAIAGGRK